MLFRSRSMSARGLLGRAGGNPNAALTRFRDHGLLSLDNKIGESAVDYVQGRLGKAELVIDLFIKRPCKKQDAPNVKPFVVLCKLFDNMMEMSIDLDDIFITYHECYEYLYPCNSYEDVSLELVEKILAERQYELGVRYPRPRVKLPDNEDTNLSIWFALNLDRSKYKVYAPKFTWLKSAEEDIWGNDEESNTLMPELRTDIVIENKEKGIQFIIDAKYYQHALVTSHHSDAPKFRREHISQVFTYMANSPFEGKKRGALLYPTVVDVVDDRLNTVHGFIFFKSINLDQDWRDISEDLLKFAEKAN